MNKLLDYVEYELASSWWAGYVPGYWLHRRIADHYTRKAGRKLKNLRKLQHIKMLIKSGATQGHVMWALRNRTWEKP